MSKRAMLIILAAIASQCSLLNYPSSADDYSACESASGVAAVASCTDAIASGKYKGHDLAKIYFNRALHQKRKEEYDRAIADTVEGILLDHEAAKASGN